MSIVTHKYMTEQMPEEEMLATFAARQHTLDFLVEALRQQIAAKTLSSYLVTGPRGAGKSMLLRMLRLRIQENVELRSAWLTVAFPEEQFNVASVRDLLAATIKLLAEQNVAGAAEWQRKVEAESDDDQSQELAIAGLREIARQQGRRFVLFIENLDEFFEYAISDEMKGTLRRLLMTDPFMMIIGSAVHIFNSLRQYDQAFFNYFCTVPLPRLSEAEVIELLQKRAHFDQNDVFLRLFPQHRPKIAAIAHLSGGNPRLTLMLYELLSQRQVGTIVQELRRLVDELTPLLKHELENLPAQQQKIIHALMEKGGTATPADLTGPTRLSLSKVTMQLRRLKESQILELRGGGKGRRAYYTVPDKLFSIWYQMRCLGSRRRQIELFVEVIRIWFEAEDRLQTLSALAAATAAPACVPHETALTAEYFAASLVGTPHEEQARSIAIQQWIRHNDVREAAFAHAEFSKLQVTGESAYETAAYAGLGNWLLSHGDLPTAVTALENASQNSNDPMVLLRYGLALGLSGNNQKACEVLNKAVESTSSTPAVLAVVLLVRGFAKSTLGDNQGAIADYTAIIGLDGAPKDVVAQALVKRGVAKNALGDNQGAIADYTAVIGLDGAPKDVVANALFGRGFAKSALGDNQGAIADYTAVIGLDGAPKDVVAKALLGRGAAKNALGDNQGAIADYTAVIGLDSAPKDVVAGALVVRGFAKSALGDNQGAIADYTAVIGLNGAPKIVVAQALLSRGVAKNALGDNQGAIADYTAVIGLDGAPKDVVARALLGLGVAKSALGDNQGAIADYTAVIGLNGAPKDVVAKAQLGRGVAKNALGDNQGAIADYTAVIGLDGAPKDVVAKALLGRGAAKSALGDNQGAIADYTAVIGLDGAPKDVVAGALVVRGVAKSALGDNQGAIADYTTVIGLDGAAKDVVAQALLGRGVACRNLGNLDGAIEDWLRVLETGEASLEDRSRAAQSAYEECVKSKTDRAQHILDQFVRAVASLGVQERIKVFVQWLSNLASPATKAAWPAAWRTLVQNQPAELVEALSVFKPVCEILEGAEISVLDALPPERRDFALKALERFGTSRTDQQKN